MALNYIWIALFLISFAIGLVKLICFGDTDIFKLMVDGTFDASKAAVMDIALPLIGIMAYYLGILKIAERVGAIAWMARLVGPFFNRLFPEIPRNHPALGSMMMNYSANLLGLDNAATPFGLKAMQELQELNPKQDTASNAQIMFLALHASGLTLLPIAIIAQRALFHAQDPSDILLPCLIATYASSLAALLVVALKQRINLLDKVILAWLLGMSGMVVAVAWCCSRYLHPGQISAVSRVFSNLLLFALPVLFIIWGMCKKLNVFEAFIDGAKESFEVSLRIIPYLVGLLVAVSMFRVSGAVAYMGDGLKWVFDHFNMDTRFTEVLPVALLRPLSGSGARAMMLDNLRHFGVDSLVGHLSSVLYGSADTTFYILALYFGAVGIKKTRYALPAMLIADGVGIVTAIWISYLFFA